MCAERTTSHTQLHVPSSPPAFSSAPAPPGIRRYVPGQPVPPGHVAAWGAYLLPAEDVRLASLREGGDGPGGGPRWVVSLLALGVTASGGRGRLVDAAVAVLVAPAAALVVPGVVLLGHGGGAGGLEAWWGCGGRGKDISLLAGLAAVNRRWAGRGAQVGGCALFFAWGTGQRGWGA